MRRPDLLAHSAPDGDRQPHAYEDHIASVQDGVRSRAAKMFRYAKVLPIDFVETVEQAAIFHDLGKLDPENQKVLAGGRQGQMAWDHVDAGTAHLSAQGNWMAAWLAHSHHAPGLPKRGNHFDLDGLGRKLRGKRYDEISREDHEAQIKRTDDHLSAYIAAHDDAVGTLDVKSAKATHGLTMRLALSCLVDADHTDTACFHTELEPPPTPPPRWEERLKSLDEYVQNLPPSGNRERDQHRRLFYQSCKDADISEAMLACEGPVGIGKTTAIMAFLLNRAKRERLRHIFIVAPYTNIIEQTVERLRKALVLPDERTEDIITEHHHRAEFETYEARDLAVLWRAPIVVTTAVQFFETLASNLPSSLRKLHELPGSAILIDEAHAALPARLWPQYWRWLTELAEQWTCHFVFASGSLTRFWENEDIVEKPVELPELSVPELQGSILRSEKKRVRYEEAGLFTSVDAFIEKICDTPGPRLVVLNTVQSAAIVARAFQERDEDVTHLSTALAPKDRISILDSIEEKLKCNSENWTLVATSCVETGVDFSFQAAFRERFSTASLIQVGGRVNRHGELDTGVVYDFLIDPGNGVTSHPAARYSAAVLKRQFENKLLTSDKYDPAELVTCAIAEEIINQGGFGHDPLVQAERFQNYPSVAEAGRLIVADTRIVVVDNELIKLLDRRVPVGFRKLIEGSVQIWSNRVDSLGLRPLPSRREIYSWPYEYDSDFLGYMAGVLKDC